MLNSLDILLNKYNIVNKDFLGTYNITSTMFSIIDIIITNIDNSHYSTAKISYNDLATLLNVSRRHTIRVINKMQDMGLIRVSKEYGRYSFYKNRYQLNINNKAIKQIIGTNHRTVYKPLRQYICSRVTTKNKIFKIFKYNNKNIIKNNISIKKPFSKIEIKRKKFLRKEYKHVINSYITCLHKMGKKINNRFVYLSSVINEFLELNEEQIEKKVKNFNKLIKRINLKYQDMKKREKITENFVKKQDLKDQEWQKQVNENPLVKKIDISNPLKNMSIFKQAIYGY